MVRKLLGVRGQARLGAGSCSQPPARRPTVTVPGGTAPGKRIEGRRCARRTAAISSLSPPKGPRCVARAAAHRPRCRKNRPGDRTGTRARHVSPWRTLSDAGRPRSGQRRGPPARDGPRTGPGKQWGRPTLRRRLDLTPGSAAKCRPPPGKLVLSIVSTVFGARLIRRQLHRPIVPAWVGKEAEPNPRELLIVGNVDAHTPSRESPTSLPDGPRRSARQDRITKVVCIRGVEVPSSGLRARFDYCHRLQVTDSRQACPRASRARPGE